MPLSNVIILTDPESDLHIDKERVATYPIQGEYSRDRLMLQRIRSYIVRFIALNLQVVYLSIIVLDGCDLADLCLYFYLDTRVKAKVEFV